MEKLPTWRKEQPPTLPYTLQFGLSHFLKFFLSQSHDSEWRVTTENLSDPRESQAGCFTSSHEEKLKAV